LRSAESTVIVNDLCVDPDAFDAVIVKLKLPCVVKVP
jgi:hypothetical protein